MPGLPLRSLGRTLSSGAHFGQFLQPDFQRLYKSIQFGGLGHGFDFVQGQPVFDVKGTRPNAAQLANVPKAAQSLAPDRGRWSAHSRLCRRSFPKSRDQRRGGRS